MTAQKPPLIVPPVGHSADPQQLPECELDFLAAVEDSSTMSIILGCEKSCYTGRYTLRCKL